MKEYTTPTRVFIGTPGSLQMDRQRLGDVWTVWPEPASEEEGTSGALGANKLSLTYDPSSK